MDWIAKAREAAAAMNLLEPDGSLRQLGSLDMIDYVVELEQATGLAIPSSVMVIARFASLDAVGELLKELSETA